MSVPSAGISSATSVSLNQQSTTNETTLVMGGYDPTVAMAVEASAGVGVDDASVQQAAADFARMAAQAIANGIPLDQVRFDDPTLTDAAKAAIYEQVALQQGTTAAQVEQQAQERAERDMQAVQGVIGALVGGAAASEVVQESPANGFAVTSVSAAALGGLTPLQVPDLRDRSREQGFDLNF